MRMRINGWLALLLIVFNLSFALPALAQSDPYGLNTARARAQLPSTVAGGSTIAEIIGKVVQYALTFIGIIFFGLVLYAGFLWMSAMGNTEKSEKAKAILEAAVVGIVLVLGAYAITQFVFTGLGSPDASTGGSTTTNPLGTACTTDTDCKDPAFVCLQGTCKLKP